MIKNPIQEVTNKLQYRAIGIVNGIYNPHADDQINRGILTDQNGKEIETVVLGKALALMRKYINFQKSYFWIVYPKNKNTQNLHLQIVGIWDPYQLNNFVDQDPKKNKFDLLEELNLTDNYFSIRGDLIYVNSQKKEIVIKILKSPRSNKLKTNNFKLVIKGEVSRDLLNSFLSLDVIRDGSSLQMIKYDVVKRGLSEK